jgi:hypothetical protein
MIGYGLYEYKMNPDRGKDVSYTMSAPALRSVKPPIQRVLTNLSPGAKQLKHKADHSPPSNAEVKNVHNFTSTHLLLHGMVFT